MDDYRPAKIESTPGQDVPRDPKKDCVLVAYEKQRITQSRGPAVEFEGRLIASDSFETRSGHPSRMIMEVWETQGGALIAVTRGEAVQGGEAREIVAATVVRSGEEQAMHFAVMSAFDWEDRARSMVRKQLKWSLKMRVE